jgi:serine O-acetyltransferase
MNEDFLNRIFESHQNCPDCPTPEKVSSFFNQVLGILFPDFSSKSYATKEELQFHLINLKEELYELFYMYPNRESISMKNKAGLFFEQLPSIYNMLLEDVNAVYEGDPAAQSESEVIKSYPGFYAISSYRMAHEIYKMDIKLIPRMMTENAHAKTGIDIHPGAKIGKRFCIDHGTGIVIGETTVIGDNVKIYQGVTLGALSVSKSDAKSKRHPTIENNVVLYAGATVLGGETTIGEGSVIGGNTWITRSVAPHSKVYYVASIQNGDEEEIDRVIIK